MRPYGLDYNVLFSENLGEFGVEFLLAVKAAYHVALGIDDKLGGDILDGVVVGVVDGLVVDVDILLHAHAAVGDIFFPGLFAAVERHGEHLEALAVILLVNLLDVGERSAAGTAPSGPEVNEHYFTLEAREAYLVAVLVFAGDIGSLCAGLDILECGDIWLWLRRQPALRESRRYRFP